MQVIHGPLQRRSRGREHGAGPPVATFALVVSSFMLALGCASTTNTMRVQTEPVRATHANAGEPAAAEREHDLVRTAGIPPQIRPRQVGTASWYGREFAGHRTASGERFDPRLFTGAHPKLPFGTWVEVRRVDTGRKVRVRINDRGPHGRLKSRIIDLSQRAAEEIDLVREGLVHVELRVVDGP